MEWKRMFNKVVEKINAFEKKSDEVLNNLERKMCMNNKTIDENIRSVTPVVVKKTKEVVNTVSNKVQVTVGNLPAQVKTTIGTTASTVVEKTGIVKTAVANKIQSTKTAVVKTSSAIKTAPVKATVNIVSTVVVDACVVCVWVCRVVVVPTMYAVCRKAYAAISNKKNNK